MKILKVGDTWINFDQVTHVKDGNLSGAVSGTPDPGVAVFFAVTLPAEGTVKAHLKRIEFRGKEADQVRAFLAKG